MPWHFRFNGLETQESVLNTMNEIPLLLFSVDGKYTSFRNITYSSINGIVLQYRIEKNWVLNPAGNGHEICRLYQKYHDDEHFRTDATITETSIFLNNRGEYEAVGSYFRKSVMTVAEIDPRRRC